MFTALAEIPERLDKIREYDHVYESPKLHLLASEVYVAMFVALEAIMTEMLKSIARMNDTSSS